VTTSGDRDAMQDRRAAWAKTLLDSLDPADLADPTMPATLNTVVDRDVGVDEPAPPSHDADAGLTQLLGLGDDAPMDVLGAPASQGVADYDDEITSDRLLAAADLYYLCLHEEIGVFRVMWKLQELFREGSLRVSAGPGAMGLYRFDKHSKLRYHRRDRLAAYLRVFGYGPPDPGPGIRPNREFHGLFTHFIAETAKYWRDKRVTEVIRERANDPTFGSVAIVRRAGLDVRQNVKNSSYGYINVLRLETGLALGQAFQVLNSDDLKAQFGAESAWDLVELVMWQHFGRVVPASTLNRMAVSGRKIISWLAQPYILEGDSRRFEVHLESIAVAVEEWISSEQGRRMSRPTPPPRRTYVPIASAVRNGSLVPPARRLRRAEGPPPLWRDPVATADL
jgi:hypothetical protein